ncbi:ECF-type sigma factor [Wenzhouxiangella marina]|uniref:RNA polymerase, sigma-24 subunit, ECF subfamily n=1 Tax=Wenzhouxiangella marina TaxID=1579979 RepID=A0A0K0XU21_9GAMM|nr:ECF-type sigma factor [Wenzhouxiangella marina]AKS41165.1 RNA polymerase, sigma-24 subunit, ECF subfamily [Wenzhouxiangella marina]MBB6088044.1 RNA polymerase sigma factor (TIGR02999 family) [Wenzhouxiangella marina]
MLDEPKQLTKLVRNWSAGDPDARESLMTQLYARLRRLARRQIAAQPGRSSLQTTALVNEAFLKLDGADIEVEHRRHFYALVARVMRQVLVDHARALAREKRGGDLLNVTLDESRAAAVPIDSELLDLDRCLERLERHHQRAARAIELSYFGGYDQATVAELMQTSLRTVERELRFGRAWLRNQLEPLRE